MKKLMCIIIYLCPVLFIVMPWGNNGAGVFAQTIEKYVSIDTGYDGYDGSQDHPWATIKNALANVSGSESAPVNIYVAQGTYYEYQINMKSYVSLYGGYEQTTWDRDIHGYETIVDGKDSTTSSNNIFNCRDNMVLDGFTIQHAPDDGVDCNSYSPVISNCHIQFCNGAGISAETGNPTILKNIIEQNKYGIQSYSTVEALITDIENNLIIGSTIYGIEACSDMRIVNNTIDRSNTYGIYVGTIGNPSPTMLIQNNNISRSLHDGIYINTTIDATGITIQYNNVYGSGSLDYGGQASPGEGDISYDPYYVEQLPASGSSTNYDYHLHFNSP